MSDFYISLGSNIHPADNLLKAAAKLNHEFGIVEYSNVWETPPYQMEGAKFLNAAAKFHSDHNKDFIKTRILRRIESELGRVRSENKYISRTIDLDILVVDLQTIDPEVWKRIHLAKPLSELLPTLINPDSGVSLLEIAEKLMSSTKIILRNDVELVKHRV